jgi:hypothetical protein
MLSSFDLAAYKSAHDMLKSLNNLEDGALQRQLETIERNIRSFQTKIKRAEELEIRYRRRSAFWGWNVIGGIGVLGGIALA